MKMVKIVFIMFRMTAFPAFTGRGRPRVPLRTLFQARNSTLLEPSTFCQLASKIENQKSMTGFEPTAVWGSYSK